jgi:hypothetical protein
MSDDLEAKRKEVLGEFERIARAFQNPDQELELDMQKVINALRSEIKAPKEVVASLDHIMHHPKELEWENLPPEDPEPPAESRPIEVEFFRNLLASDLIKQKRAWGPALTRQGYLIDYEKKTFTLYQDTNHEKSPEWHRRTTANLKVLGWKMIDTHSDRNLFRCISNGWIISLADYPIWDQVNEVTGKNYPPGTRGQDAYANHMEAGRMIRLGNKIGRWFFTNMKELPEYGKSKSTAAGAAIRKETNG